LATTCHPANGRAILGNRLETPLRLLTRLDTALRWIGDEQVYGFSFAVHFDQLRLEIGTTFSNMTLRRWMASPLNTFPRSFFTKAK
jgi:hypothetical protein